MKIKAVIYIFVATKSRRIGFRYIDTLTGKSSEGIITGGESNIKKQLGPDTFVTYIIS